jgi:hypothetical protein
MRQRKTSEGFFSLPLSLPSVVPLFFIIHHSAFIILYYFTILTPALV